MFAHSRRAIEYTRDEVEALELKVEEHEINSEQIPQRFTRGRMREIRLQLVSARNKVVEARQRLEEAQEEAQAQVESARTKEDLARAALDAAQQVLVKMKWPERNTTVNKYIEIGKLMQSDKDVKHVQEAYYRRHGKRPSESVIWKAWSFYNEYQRELREKGLLSDEK